MTFADCMSGFKPTNLDGKGPNICFLISANYNAVVAGTAQYQAELSETSEITF